MWDEDSLPDDDELLDDVEGESDAGLTAAELAEALRGKETKRCVPVLYNHKISKKRIAVVDSETDPFEKGLVVKPFTIGFYTGDRYVDFWGDDCVKQFFDYLATLDEEFIIYAHNGGKFDFFFFLDHLDVDQTPLIMGGRLVKISFGGQEFRDSYAIIPQALSKYKKDEIDYDKFKRNVREKNRKEILHYQQTDCIYTYELIQGFHDVYGDGLTIAGVSMRKLNSYHGFERLKSEEMDERFRNFYYGGRNQCFKTGKLKGNWKLYDRNSMYPKEMRDTLHPVSSRCQIQRDILPDTDFARIIAKNDNCLPVRREDGSLDFTVKYGEFYATIHEIKAGLETKTIRIDRVKQAWAFDRKANFSTFVDEFYNMRLDAKADDNKVLDILYKFGLNSPYGKFALNPRKFKQWAMTRGEIPEPQATPDNLEGWSLATQSGDMFIWSRPSPRKGGFYNVATAASITGAARANLHRNLALATNPIYCDTDSILCEGFAGELNDSELGGWKLEATGTLAAIAGKKLYALIDEGNDKWILSGEAVKHASKGVRLTPQQILDVCDGREIIYENPVPTFKLDGSADFINRKIRMTG